MCTCIKIVNEYSQKNEEKLPKEAHERLKIFLKKKKKKKQKKARDIYKSLSEEEKDKKRQYHRN